MAIKKQQDQKINFNYFLEKFPEVELPVTLTPDSHHAFSENNKPFPARMIEQYIHPLEKENPDEFTEFLPCFKIPNTIDFHAVVYWKASLLIYEYTMVTFSKKGELIDKKVIAGTKSSGQTLIQSVATIEEDWIITVIEGIGKTAPQSFVAESSKPYQLELLADGRVIYL